MSDVVIESARRRVAALIAPLAPLPCGIDARLEQSYQTIRNEVGKLQSPGAPPVDWALVAQRGSEFLSGTSKDLVIASYTAHALYEHAGLEGLATALLLVNALMETYWEPLFPPPSRMRARSGAISWWVEKTGTRLALDRASASPELLELLDAEAAKLAASVRARMGDAAPAVGPLQQALQRLRLASAAGPAQPRDEGAALGTAPESAPASPPAVDASTARIAESTALDGNAAISPAATSDADLDAQLDARASRFIAPIAGACPSGVDARYDDSYVRIREAIKGLDMPTTQPVDWQRVLADGSGLLETRSKDLLIAAHVAFALYQLHKLDGLLTGLCVLHGLIDRHWDGLYPDLRRGTRARANALAWFLGRLERLGEHALGPDDVQLLPKLARAAARLEAQGDTFAEHRPAFTPLLSALARLALAAQASIPPDTAQPPAIRGPAAVTPAGSIVQLPAAATAAPIPMDAGPAPELANKAELNRFFTRLRGQLWDLATALRTASDRDPLAYRLSRVASYLTLVELLQHKERVTLLPAPSPLIASEVAQQLNKQQWDKLLALAEGSLRKSPYLLDLHRQVHVALGHLGPGHAAAQRAVEGELIALLRRVPELPELKFQDGTAFASEDTRAFLAELTRGSETASQGGPGETWSVPADELKAATALVAAGRTDQALDAFHALLARIGSGRDRFRARLAMAGACATAGSDSMAVALFEGLIADLDRHGLDEWEPALASECLAGYHQCLKALAPRDKEMAQSAAVVYRRLCRVDPKRALAAGLRI